MFETNTSCEKDPLIASSKKMASGLQDAFLKEMVAKSIPVTVFLVSGIKLQGCIIAYDSFCFLLKKDQIIQLLYKHAISSVMPMAPFAFDYNGTI
jgi:host factor-I protein